MNRGLLFAAFLTVFAACSSETRTTRTFVGVMPDAPDTAMPPVLAENEHMKFGYPGGLGIVLTKKSYVILFDTTKMLADWVAYHLTRENLQGEARRRNNFRADPELPEGRRAELDDYKDSGFDRGHMAAAADFKRSDEAMSETFFLSNMAPQWPNLNRITWARLEEEVRELANTHGSIWMFTGPLYVDSLDRRSLAKEHIGLRRVAVPTHFFKVILCEHSDGKREMYAFVVKNQREKLPGVPKDYRVTVRKVEELSGFNFFHRLPDDEETLLETTAGSIWPVQ